MQIEDGLTVYGHECELVLAIRVVIDGERLAEVGFAEEGESNNTVSAVTP